MPDIEFTLEDLPRVDLVWMCGYEPGEPELVRAMRARHPRAVLVVSAKGPEELWSGEVLAAGADCAMPWPVDFAHLSRVLHREALRNRA